jgi:hypothetical protein
MSRVCVTVTSLGVSLDKSASENSSASFYSTVNNSPTNGTSVSGADQAGEANDIVRRVELNQPAPTSSRRGSPIEPWSTEKSALMFGIENWGEGYFAINQKGNVIVRPNRNGVDIDVSELIASLVQRGIDVPVLLRFDGIIRDRVHSLGIPAPIAECFQ